MRLFLTTMILATAMNTFAGTRILLQTETIQTDGVTSFAVDSADKNTAWMVQSKAKVSEKFKKTLIKNNLQVVSYLPEDTVIVLGSAKDVARLERSLLQAILPLKPDQKISRDVGVLAPATLATVQAFLVSLFSESDLKQVSEMLKAKGITVRHGAGTSLVVSTERKNLLSIAALSEIEHIQTFPNVEPLHIVFPGEQAASSAAGDYTDLDGSESGTAVMNFSAAWNLNYFGQNQIVGMADTGLDSGDARAIHTDFSGAVKSGYAVGMFGKTWADPMGHGTHVAGSVLGRGTSSGGKLKGGAYEAQMVAQGMWSPILDNLSVPSDLAKMFTQAYADGARTHTNSWGAAANFGAYEKMAATVDQVMFDKEDLLVIFAAGNSGVDKNRDGRIDPNSVGTPGTAKNALTVGASENLTATGGIQKKVGELASAKDNWPVAPITLSGLSDNQDGIAMFSSRGPTADGRIKPDVVAPGTNILSVKSQQSTAGVLWGQYNPDYVWSGGTSMAAPLAAGAAAIARQILIEKITPNPSAALVKAYVLQTSTELFPGQYGQAGAGQGQEILTLRPNNDEGYGRVNVAEIADTSSIVAAFDERAGLATGESFTKSITAKTAGRLVVNLVWTDAPGSPNAAKALVNDLDLKVALANGQVLNINDQINNHAFAQSDVAAGTSATITVSASNVPMGKNGKQPFALVISVQ